MSVKVYKVRDTRTGLYSKADIIHNEDHLRDTSSWTYRRQFTTKGKVWDSATRFRRHLDKYVDRYGKIPSYLEVVVFNVILAEITPASEYK